MRFYARRHDAYLNGHGSTALRGEFTAQRDEREICGLLVWVFGCEEEQKMPSLPLATISHTLILPLSLPRHCRAKASKKKPNAGPMEGKTHLVCHDWWWEDSRNTKTETPLFLVANRSLWLGEMIWSQWCVACLLRPCWRWDREARRHWPCRTCPRQSWQSQRGGLRLCRCGPSQTAP